MGAAPGVPALYHPPGNPPHPCRGTPACVSGGIWGSAQESRAHRRCHLFPPPLCVLRGAGDLVTLQVASGASKPRLGRR